MLFKDAPELIGEFKAFLPEAVGSAGGGAFDHGGMIGAQQLGPHLGAWGQREQENRHPSPPLTSKKQPAANKSRKKRPLEKEPTPVPVPPPKASSSRVRPFVL